MHANAECMYTSLHDFIYELVGDRISAARVVNILNHANVPLQTFITAVKLYRMILNRTNRMSIMRHTQGVNLGGQSSRTQSLSQDELGVLRNQQLVFISCCMIASKYYRDIAFTNESWEVVSGTARRHLNESERICLIALDYQVNGQGDHLVQESVATILKRSGIILTDKALGRGVKFKNMIRKLLCFS